MNVKSKERNVKRLIVEDRLPTLFEVDTPFIKIQLHSHPSVLNKACKSQNIPILQHLHFLNYYS